MYRKRPANVTTIKCNEGYEGETIEQKVARIENNKEGIKDGACNQKFCRTSDGHK